MGKREKTFNRILSFLYVFDNGYLYGGKNWVILFIIFGYFVFFIMYIGGF